MELKQAYKEVTKNIKNQNHKKMVEDFIIADFKMNENLKNKEYHYFSNDQLAQLTKDGAIEEHKSEWKSIRMLSHEELTEQDELFVVNESVFLPANDLMRRLYNDFS
jgi:hypothetical protein